MVTRIRQLLEHKQLTPTQFADFIGVGRPVMSHILSERNKPSLEVVQRMISAFPDISIPWLLSGAGDMLATEAASPPAPPALAEPLGEVSDSGPASEPPAPASPAEASHPTTSLAPEAETLAPLPAPPMPLAASSPPGGLPRPFAAPKLTQMAPIASVPPLATEPAVLPDPALPPEAGPGAPPVRPQPFRAARVGASAQVASPPGPKAPEPAALAAVPLSPPVGTPPAPATTTIGLSTGSNAEADLLPFLAESRKSIRRIVIFYRDGSFADYQPE